MFYTFSIFFLKFTVWFFFITLTSAQVKIGDWKAFTSPINIRQIISTDNIVLAATEGGLLVFDDQNYTTLTTIEGLVGVDLGAVDWDPYHNVAWIGGKLPFGFIQIYDIQKKSSIKIFDFGLTAIIDFEILDSQAFVLFQDGQDMGIMKFKYDQTWQYLDNYKNFPSEMGSIIGFAVTNTTIFLGTDSGVWIGNLNSNLKDPNNWEQPFSNLMSSITAVESVESSILISTEESLVNINPLEMVTTPFESLFTIFSFSNMVKVEQSWWFAKENFLFRKSNDGTILELKFDQPIMTLHADEANGLIIGFENGFKLLPQISGDISIDSFQKFIPNAPATSGFTAITVLDDGRLIGGSSHGLSILNEDGWRNILEIKEPNSQTIHFKYDYSEFIGDTVPYDFGGFISDLEQGPDGLVYCAIRGSRVYLSNPPRYSGGIIVVDIDNPANISIIDTSYLSYHTTSNDPFPYQVVLDIEFDKDGNMWVADPYSINGNNPIHVRSTNGVWKHFGSAETSIKISQSPNAITFDSWDRVWVSAFQAEEANLGIYPNGGLFMLDYDGLPYNPESFTWQKIIAEGTIRSIAMGMSGRLFYLTPSGLNYFDLRNSNNPIIRENPYSYFPNISFGNGAEIKVDPHGNIWTHSPTQGVHVLLENSTYWPDINGFRTSNSPLLSDQITDIDFDPKNNLAYIATSKGLNVVRIPFGSNKNDYKRVKVYPSPFYLPTEESMKVDGLPFLTSMIIMTLDGSVIRKVVNKGISIDGDQLSWDGRDTNGDYVSSGVYLLVIYGSEGENMVDKITVVRYH